jgi:hypothetical protein
MYAAVTSVSFMGFSSSIFSARKTADTTHSNAQLFAPVWERSNVTNEQQWAQEHKGWCTRGAVSRSVLTGNLPRQDGAVDTLVCKVDLEKDDSGRANLETPLTRQRRDDVILYPQNEAFDEFVLHFWLL